MITFDGRLMLGYKFSKYIITESLNKTFLRLIECKSPRLKVEELFFAQLPDRRTMRSFHIIGIDFEVGVTRSQMDDLPPPRR